MCKKRQRTSEQRKATLVLFSWAKKKKKSQDILWDKITLTVIEDFLLYVK